MAFQYKDRVQETTTTTGTGSLTLAGAVTGYQSFNSALSSSDTCHYAISDTTNGAWEVGIGTFTATSTLARTTILASSNSGSVVTLAAGTKQVFITVPSSALRLEFNVKSFGAKGGGITDDTTAIQTAITAAAALGGTVFFPADTYKVVSSSRTDTVSYSSGSTFNDTSAASGDVGKYVLWGNLGRVSKITSVVVGTSFTVDVLPTTHAATTAKIIAPAFVIPEGVYLLGVGSNINHQLTAGASTSQTVSQIADSGTGVTALIQGANSVSGNSTRFGISKLSLIGNSANTYGLFVGNGAWMIDSEDLELSSHGIAGLALDGNINSHDFRNLILYGNGNALASTPTGGVITHPFNAGGSASCNLYNPFFTADIGFGICDGLDTNGAYGVVLYSPQFNSIQTSAMTNSGTSMVLQSKNTGDGMASVYGGWSESAGLYDIITTGFVTVSGTRMHSSHAYHWIVNGGVANAVGCTFEGASTATANITSGEFTWNSIKCADPILYSGAPTTIPSIGTSGTLFGNAATNNGMVTTGNFTVKDAATATKAMRFQTSAAALDVAFGGAQNFISNWTGADFTGTQVFYMAFDTAGNFDAFKVWRFHTAPFGTTWLTIDPGVPSMEFNDGMNIDFGTSTGTIIGNASNEKLAFWGNTPIVQPSGDISAALVSAGLIVSPAFSDEAPLAPSTSQTVTANYSAGANRKYKIASGTKLTLGSGAIFRIL